MTHDIIVKLRLTNEEIASLDRMVESSGAMHRTGFVLALLREIIADEMSDNEFTCSAGGYDTGAEQPMRNQGA